MGWDQIPTCPVRSREGSAHRVSFRCGPAPLSYADMATDEFFTRAAVWGEPTHNKGGSDIR